MVDVSEWFGYSVLGLFSLTGFVGVGHYLNKRRDPARALEALDKVKKSIDDEGKTITNLLELIDAVPRLSDQARYQEARELHHTLYLRADKIVRKELTENMRQRELSDLTGNLNLLHSQSWIGALREHKKYGTKYASVQESHRIYNSMTFKFPGLES